MKKEKGLPNFIGLEEDIIKFWKENNSFQKFVKKNENSDKYYRFLDGPITANYPMGVHHAWNRSLKDFMLRYKGLRGYGAHYQNGFDAHGLPVELGVEKELGLEDKRDIQKLGMDKFVELCMQRVDKYSKIIRDQSIRLGQWMDWDNSYFTNSNENITSIWYFLKKCHENGWITEKYRPLPWCAHCGTSLSEHELADSYKDMEHTAVFFKAKLTNDNRSILVWTTTPWTLSSNVAVAVNPELDYVVCKVKSDDRLFVVCDQAKKVLKSDIIEIVETLKGKDLVGLEYEAIFPEFEKQQFEHKVVAWDMVDATEGTGVVHIAPGCGAEDFELGQAQDLPVICPIDENGIFEAGFGFLTNKSAMNVADLVFHKLKENGKLYYTHKYTHRYPTCARCKNPLVFRLTKEWYIKADEIRPNLISKLDSIKWQPEFLQKRMYDWLANMGDWSISRKRFYGVPLPFYRCKECGELTVVGSLKELEELSSKEEVAKIPHLHRPYIDSIKIKCPKCGAHVERVPEVGDCWLDAGITPFSTKKYFSDKAFFEKNFPAECVVEMREQVRLWFYSLLFMSVTILDKAPYEKVIGFASLVNEEGQKFSKSGKNNISFFDAADKIGSDVIRYMYASNNMLNDTRFGYAICDEMRRKLMGLWNAYVFYGTYASIDNPDVANYKPDFSKMDISDQWLITITNKLIKNSTNYYDNQNFCELIKEFEIYVDDLTNWYIRINRRRFWKSDDKKDQMDAYWTLYHALKNVIIVMSPIIPFMTEYIWQKMVRESENNAVESIFLNNYPEKVADFNNEELIKQVEDARNIINLVSRLRNEKQIKVKQPLKTLYICSDKAFKKSVEKFENIIKDELNIKNIIFEHDTTKFNDEYLTLNFKTAGAVLKGDINNVKNALQSAEKADMQKYVAEFKAGKVNVLDKELDKDLFILNVKPKEEFVIASENLITVVLDITIDEGLMLEGLSRELVRNAQVLRKEAGFNVEDRIYVEFETESEVLNKILTIYKEKIASELLVKEFQHLENYDIEKELEINDEKIVVKMKKA